MLLSFDKPLQADEIDRMVASLRGSLERGNIVWLVNVAVAEFAGNAGQALTGAKDRDSQHLRHVAIYLGHTTLQLPEQACAGVFGLHKSQATRAIQQVETRRAQDPAYNLKIERLEATLVRLRGSSHEVRPVPPTQGLSDRPVSAFAEPAGFRSVARAR